MVVVVDVLTVSAGGIGQRRRWLSVKDKAEVLMIVTRLIWGSRQINSNGHFWIPANFSVC